MLCASGSPRDLLFYNLGNRNYFHCTDEETEIYQKNIKRSQFCFKSKYFFHYTLSPQIMRDKREDRKASEVTWIDLSRCRDLL